MTWPIGVPTPPPTTRTLDNNPPPTRRGPRPGAPRRVGSYGRPVGAVSGSADALGQRDDDPFRPADVGHPPSALVLADATDQSVALGSCPIDSRLQVVDLEGHVAQSQLVGHGGR